MSYLLPYLVLLLLRDGVAVFAHEVELQGLHLPADVALSHVSTQLLYSVGLVALLIRHWANSRTLPDQQKAELLLLHHLNLLRNEYIGIMVSVLIRLTSFVSWLCRESGRGRRAGSRSTCPSRRYIYYILSARFMFFWVTELLGKLCKESHKGSSH